METLEINVSDSVGVWEVFGSVQEAVSYIEKWFTNRVLDNREDIQLTVSIKKGQKTGPPVLGINVTDSVSAEGGLV